MILVVKRQSKVMYVRSEEQGNTTGNDKRRGGGRDDRRGNDKRGGDRRDGARQDRGGRSNRPEGGREGRRSDNRNDAPRERSPWRTVSKPDSEELANDHGGIVGKSQIDPEQLRKQRQEETRIYGENACQAMFKTALMRLFARGSCNLSRHVFVMH